VSAQGEDRSDFQAVLPPVDTSGKKLDFILLKATEGTSWVSTTYHDNIALAKKYGVPYGSYHFLHPSLDVGTQVALFMSTVDVQGGLEPGAILAVDSEITSGKNGQLILHSDRSSLLIRNSSSGEGLIRPGVDFPSHWPRSGHPKRLGSASQVDLATLQFITEVRTAVEVGLGGDYCQEIVYTFADMLPSLPSCTDFPLWLAYFSDTAPETVRPWDTWSIWQYAGGGGNGGSDQDGFNGEEAAFNTWRLTKMPVAPSPVPSASTSTFSVTVPNLALGDLDKAGTPVFVHRLQWLLAGLSTVTGISAAVGLAADGDFGPKTEAAVEAIQKFAKLPVTGRVGPADWKFLFAAVYGTA
jgi:Putative peptidoglycan binding domain/Glycosyl hydrolases family 25